MKDVRIVKHNLIIAIAVIACFLLQSTICQFFALAGVVPNLMIITIASFAVMGGPREGLWIGLFAGFLMDLFYGDYIGVYSLIYMYLGFICGIFQKWFYPEDLKMPLLLVGGCDLTYGFIMFAYTWVLRGNHDLAYSLRRIILPELIYTMLIAVFLYLLYLKISQVILTGPDAKPRKESRNN